jgi:hypothetical protein
MGNLYSFTVERQSTGLAWARRIGNWTGYAAIVLGIPFVLDAPKGSGQGPVLAIILWLLWSGSFALAIRFGLPELYLRLRKSLRYSAAEVEISATGLRIEGIGLLAWHTFSAQAGRRPNSILVTFFDTPLAELSGSASQECLAQLSRQCPPRQLPDIGPDGCLENPHPEAFAAGTMMSQRHGDTDVLYSFAADEGLAACAAQTSRILLGHATQTFTDRRMTAQANALVMVFLATVPVLAIAALLGPVFLASIPAAAAWGFWKEMRTPGKVWTRSEWLDLDARTWNARREYPDHSLATQNISLPLADLVLICFTQQWEQGISHDVGLCKASELKTREHQDPNYLNMVHSADDPSAAELFAIALAKMWKIPCWKIEGGIAVQKKQLA